MNIKKWFRIELDASGAILSCSEVEAAGKSRGDVRFVEALDAAGAVVCVKRWFENRRTWHREYLAARTKNGLCTDCGCKLPTERLGKRRCIACTKRRSDRQREIRHGATRKIRQRTTDPQIAKLRSDEVTRRSQKLRGGSYATTLRSILVRIDRDGPQQLRAWLVQEINRRSAPEKQVQ